MNFRCRAGKTRRSAAGFPAALLFRFRGGQFLDSYVSELDSGSVSEQSDVSRGVEESGMVLVVHGVGVVFPAVGGHVVALAGLPDVSVENHLAVYRHGDSVSHGAYPGAGISRVWPG